MALSPQLSNLVPNCPIACELTSTDSFDPIFDFTDATGDLVIKTMLADLATKTHSYSIECISELSLVQTLPEVQTFDVEFEYENCDPKILLNGVSMPDYDQYWFTQAGQSQAVPEYFLVSDCSLVFTYSAKARLVSSTDPDEDDESEFVALEDMDKNVLSFDPATRTFSMAMCDPYDSASADGECDGDAFFFTYEVMVVATLDDGARTSDDSLRFLVHYGPDCSADTLAFFDMLGDQTYYVSSDSSEDIFDAGLE